MSHHDKLWFVQYGEETVMKSDGVTHMSMETVAMSSGYDFRTKMHPNRYQITPFIFSWLITGVSVSKYPG